MSIKITGYTFEGPYTYTSTLKNQSGVYAILTPISYSNYKVLDIGESATVKTRVESHDRVPCWKRYANNGKILYAVYYTDERNRKIIEQTIRKSEKPPCGDE